MKTIVRNLKHGDVIEIDGHAEVVKGLAYGNGLIAFETKVSKPVIVSFASGNAIKAHPENTVSVRRV